MESLESQEYRRGRFHDPVWQRPFEDAGAFSADRFDMQFPFPAGYVLKRADCVAPFFAARYPLNEREIGGNSTGSRLVPKPVDGPDNKS